MGVRQSKRSVDISGTPKKGEMENGTVTGTAEEKLEKISEGDTVAKVNANGMTTTTTTAAAEQQQESASATPATQTETTTTTTTAAAAENAATVTPSKIENDAAEEKAKTNEDVTSPVTSTPEAAASDDSKQEPSSPTSPTEQQQSSEEGGGGGSEKKKKPKRKWSFKSWSFSKKDRVKPPSMKDEKQETVPEDNEHAAQQTEQVKTETTNATPVQNEEPPPLPSSPPPTPAEEGAVTEKEETPIISEGDVDASGGGESLAEPIGETELDVSTSVISASVEQPLTNGVSDVRINSWNGSGSPEENDDKLAEDESVSPVCERQTSVESVTAKIGSLKLQIAADNADVPSQNGVDEAEPIEMNGVAEKNDASLEKAIAEN